MDRHNGNYPWCGSVISLDVIPGGHSRISHNSTHTRIAYFIFSYSFLFVLIHTPFLSVFLCSNAVSCGCHLFATTTLAVLLLWGWHHAVAAGGAETPALGAETTASSVDTTATPERSGPRHQAALFPCELRGGLIPLITSVGVASV